MKVELCMPREQDEALEGEGLIAIECRLDQRYELQANSAAAMPAVLRGAGEAAVQPDCSSFTGGRVVPGQNAVPSPQHMHKGCLG